MHHFTAAMERALGLAVEGPRGANPLVGAVVVDARGNIIAEGRHLGAGTPHAEVDALAAYHRLTGPKPPLTECTMVVTLEPCNHTGRTGPCSQAILDAGIPAVVVGSRDPNPLATGGAATLADHGIEVMDLNDDTLASGLGNLNRRWLRAVAEHRPFVTLKTAQTIDGRIAAHDGSSQWITGEEARAFTHVLRSRADAVLVGTGTVAADNPRLTARLAGADLPKQPLAAMMGVRTLRDLAGPEGAPRIQDAPGGFLHLPTRDPAQALRRLWEHGIRHVLVEGGSRVAAAFLGAGLVDELFVQVGPEILGSGTPAVRDLGITSLSRALRWELDPAAPGSAAVFGQDVSLHYQPAADSMSE